MDIDNFIQSIFYEGSLNSSSDLMGDVDPFDDDYFADELFPESRLFDRDDGFDLGREDADGPDLDRVAPADEVECYLCFGRFANVRELRPHLEVHGRQKSFPCGRCGADFSSSTDVWRHNSAEHGAGGREVCVICDRTFKAGLGFHRHMMIHTGELPETCPHCPKSFRMRPVLAKHILTHTGVKAHSCHACSKRFKTKKELKQHSFVHLSAKAFECGGCGRRFKFVGSLRRHVKKGRCNPGKRRVGAAGKGPPKTKVSRPAPTPFPNSGLLRQLPLEILKSIPGVPISRVITDPLTKKKTVYIAKSKIVNSINNDKHTPESIELLQRMLKISN